ncbi:MAG: DNA-3-methyladenine glycosylase 2 family protein [Ignavibacteria bacterium]
MKNKSIKVATLKLLPTAPFRLDLTTWALRRRPTNAVDQWDGEHYTRLLVVDGQPVKIILKQRGTDRIPELSIILKSGKELTVGTIGKIRMLLEKMLGLKADLKPFYKLAKINNVLKPLAKSFIGVKPPRFPTLFEALINSIACQQVTLTLGIMLLNRLAATFGTKFVDGDKLIYAFPSPEDLAAAPLEDIKKLGFSRQKVKAIKELSNSIINKGVPLLEELEEMTSKQTVEHLLKIHGIGRWSAEYVLLRGLGRIDIFPGDDVGAQKNLMLLMGLKKLPNYDEVKKITAGWQPYCGLVYFHLLLDKLQKKNII